MTNGIKMDTASDQWWLECDEPWTRYRALVDLLGRPASAPEVQDARAKMLAHPQVQALIAEAAAWPGYALKRHNDAKHPLYKLSTLADFGLQRDDPGMRPALEAVIAQQSNEGAFQSLVNIPKAFGGTGEDAWTWIACDAPTLLYSLLAMGLYADPSVQRALEHVLSLAGDGGWGCRAAEELGRFKGPGRRGDPCPIANVYALKVLAQVPELLDHPAAHAGAEMLLWHWELQGEKKYFLFGVGTDFRKLKYPFVWYDILHVADVLSRFPHVHGDPRFRAMVSAITSQADVQGGYTARSMYRAWKGWSFADKKHPSPWLTYLVRRIELRMAVS
jgi:hypothetical protein